MKTKAERIQWLEDCKQFCKNDEQAITAFDDMIDDIRNEPEQWQINEAVNGRR